ncbi:MAG: hypothetical protein GWP09_02465 [Nitrospiraceae bacterium]|nr:hypothetical protein [Nitrospiraceae bacterium]
MHGKFIHGKKAQAPPIPRNANWAGSLVIVIGVLIVFYILFLPPNARNEFLNITNNQTSGLSNVTGGQNLLLFSANPGKILPKSSNMKYSEGHSIDDIRISALTEAKVLRTENPFFIKSNIFSSKTKKIMFKINDLDNTNNILLSFTSSKHKGILEIYLNGYEIMNYELSSSNIKPVELPKDYLQDQNVLEFKVSRGFLLSNYYNIENLKVTAYVKNKLHSKSTSTFQISDTELQTIDSAKLTYFIQCHSNEEGKLSIDINGYSLGSFMPDCDSFRKIEFPVSYLSSGDNYLNFATDGGDYLLSQIKITPVFKDINIPTYYFEIQPEDYKKIENNTKEVVLTMRFPDSSDKQAKIYVNGYVIGLSTNDLTFEKVIDKDYLFEHMNALKIEPDRTLEITQLRVELRNEE